MFMKMGFEGRGRKERNEGRKGTKEGCMLCLFRVCVRVDRDLKDLDQSRDQRKSLLCMKPEWA